MSNARRHVTVSPPELLFPALGNLDNLRPSGEDLDLRLADSCESADDVHFHLIRVIKDWE